MCQDLRALFAERVLESCEYPISDASEAARLYIESWKNHLKRIEQLVHDSTCAGVEQVEKPVNGSVGTNNSSSTGARNVGDDTGVGFFCVMFSSNV